MFTLVHGDNPFEIDAHVEKNFLNQGYTNFHGTFSDLLHQISSTSLFVEVKNTDLYVYNLEVNSPVESKTFDMLSEMFSANNSKELVLVDYKKHPKTFCNKFDKTLLFDISSSDNIFKLLDSLFENKSKEALALLQDYIAKSREPYVLSMVFYMLKNLLLFEYNRKEFLKLNPYVQKKVGLIAQKTSIRKTKNVILALSEADYKMKSGGDVPTILSSLFTYISK